MCTQCLSMPVNQLRGNYIVCSNFGNEIKTKVVTQENKYVNHV
jgi:hypothetical protein